MRCLLLSIALVLLTTTAPGGAENLLTLPTVTTLPGLCVTGDPRACDDGVDCTRDQCVLGVCIHQPQDADCDRGDCELDVCQPAGPKADHRGCVAVAVREGNACTDDGFACTADVCMRGVCLHVPVDARCVAPTVCSSPACAPSRPDRDADGCVAGAPLPDGAPCAEDGDLCTRDVCRASACEHEPEGDVAACAPLQQPFQQASGLGNLAAGLATDIASDDGDVAPLLARLASIQDDLAAAAAALEGDSNGTPTTLLGTLSAFAACVLDDAPAAASGLTAQERARIAFTHVLRTPREISAFLELLSEARARAALGPAARDLRRRGRTLLRGTRRLRATLKHVAS